MHSTEDITGTTIIIIIKMYFMIIDNNTNTNNKLYLLRVKPYKLLNTYLPKGPLG